MTTRQPTQTENSCPVCGKPENEHKDGLFCCPFCGSSESKYYKRIEHCSPPDHYIECNRCFSMAYAGAYQEKEKAKEVWNARA